MSYARGSPESMLLRMSVERNTTGLETQSTGISMQMALTHLGLAGQVMLMQVPVYHWSQATCEATGMPQASPVMVEQT